MNGKPPPASAAWATWLSSATARCCWGALAFSRGDPPLGLITIFCTTALIGMGFLLKAVTRESIVDSMAVATFAMLDGEALDLARKEIRAAMQWALIPREESEAAPVELVSTVRILTRSERSPIPPALVIVLRAHPEEFGTAPDGRLFCNERGGVLGASTYARVWREARRFTLIP